MVKISVWIKVFAVSIAWGVFLAVMVGNTVHTSEAKADNCKVVLKNCRAQLKRCMINNPTTPVWLGDVPICSPDTETPQSH